jgi:hypothetical protein
VNSGSTIRTPRAEAGIALLISIFVLLLISVVAIALIVSSGTETSLAGNYRSSASVYYAASAGLEEARTRLSPKDPNSFQTTWTSFYPAPNTTLPIGTIGYVLNPGPTETAANILTTYPDTEYDSEFAPGSTLASATIKPPTLSVWNKTPMTSNLSFPPPLYKWVRINAVSEKSLNLDVDADGLADSITPLYYDTITNPTKPRFSNNSAAGPQVFEVTSLAVLPNGNAQNSQKLVQYLVAPAPVPLPPFLAALTLSGGGATYHAPNGNSSYSVKGNDQDCTGNSTGTNYPAIGVFTDTDRTNVISGIPSSPATVRPSYTGLSTAPDVERIDATFPANLQIPANLDALAQTIIQNADVVITPTPSGSPPFLGTATGSSLTPLGMTSSNLLTVVVNGNLDISNWSNDGYGLLLVTGTFTYDPDTTWDGIILVIGQGIVGGDHAQFKQINGAVFVAKTRDGNNQVLTGSSMGAASVVFQNSMQGAGIRYSSCWIQKATPTASYKVLSYHEIAQ